MPLTNSHWYLIAVIVVAELIAPLRVVAAQDSSTTGQALTYSSPAETTWEFGLKINSTGLAQGITATVPIPMEWPEQSINSAVEFKSDNISSLKINNPTPESRQLVFTVNRLAAGETAEAMIRFQITKRMIAGPNDLENLTVPTKITSALKAFLKPSPQIESTHKRILEIAAKLRDPALTDWQQVEVNLKWVRENIEYKFDTEIHSCLEALDSQHGDCEELSSLFIAICRAMKIPARAVWIPHHTYPEFFLEDQTGQGYWFPCQAAGQYEFGSMTELKPVLQKGDRFRLAGKSGYVRYLQPSLLAKDAQGELSIEWISREVTAAPNK